MKISFRLFTKKRAARVRWEGAIKNFVVFIAALIIGGPLGTFFNGLLGLASTSYLGTGLGYFVTFTVYVFASRWFRAKPSFD